MNREYPAGEVRIFKWWAIRASMPRAVVALTFEQIVHHGVGRFVAFPLCNVQRPQTVADGHRSSADAFPIGDALAFFMECVPREFSLALHEVRIDCQSLAPGKIHCQHRQCLMMAGKTVTMFRIVFGCLLNDAQPLGDRVANRFRFDSFTRHQDR